jgi:hypothetical protein
MMKTEGSGSASGSISQRHGSAAPDPHQNVLDPQHCSLGRLYLKHFPQNHSSQGGERAGFVDESVAAGEGGTNLPGTGLQRIVPRPDSSYEVKKITGRSK